MESSGNRLRPVSRDSLCITEGTIDPLSSRGLSVTVPKMRAYVKALDSTGGGSALHVSWLDGQRSAAWIGQLRRQFGLKLASTDPCNLVYAMWPGGFRQEQSRPAHQHGMRESRIPQHQAAAQQANSDAASPRDAHASWRAARRGDESLCRRLARVRGRDQFRYAGFRRAGRDAIGQCPVAG